MIELLLGSLTVGSFFFVIVLIRILTKNQVNEALHFLADDWVSQRKNINFPPSPKRSVALQESSKRLKD